MKLKRLTELFSRSSVPGLAMLFAAKHPFRRLLWAAMFTLCLFLTLHSLLEILRDFLQYPITVNVLVSESRVLRFPAVTVCNLNPLHRGRFCRAQLPKPPALQQVLCASLDSLMQVCGIYELLDQLVTQGERICNSGTSGERRRQPGYDRGKKKNTTATTVRPSLQKPAKNGSQKRRPYRNKKKPNYNQYGRDQSNKLDLNDTDGEGYSIATFQVPYEEEEEETMEEEIRTKLISKLNLEDNFWEEVAAVLNEKPNELERFIQKGLELDMKEEFLHDLESDLNAEADDDLNDMMKEPNERKVPNKKNQSEQKINRIPRQINYRTIFRVLHSLATGRFSSFRQILSMFGITGESEAFFDNMIVQIAKFARIHINSTQELIPALFLKSFADSTGCQIGAQNADSPNNINLALQNLTKAFTNPKCILKLPRLFELFSRQSKNLTEGLYRCTGNWVGELLKDELPPPPKQSYGSFANSFDFDISKPAVEKESNRGSENSWYVLLDLLRSWIAELSRNRIDQAIQIGHQKKDLISSCYFAGKRCDMDRDLHQIFFSTYGNCYTYNFQRNEDTEQSLSGFTGPQFGLEIVLNLETSEYMPTTREIGAKVMVHDPKKKADPEQDAVQIQPGVVTYVGVQMINISRAPAPYKDRCSDEWPTREQQFWAQSAEHTTYTTQVCLKMCLQKEIIHNCQCWTLTAPGPIGGDLPICNTRKNQTIADCTARIRNQYYSKKIVCNCPPRCSEEIYEKFVSTGKESRQCSALSANAEQEQSSGDDTNNYAKLLVYYQSLSYNAIQQSPKYTSESLVGAIGGILGVYLGFSFLAIYEFAEILVRSGYLLCCLKRPSSPEVAHHGSTIIYTNKTPIPADELDAQTTVKQLADSKVKESSLARRLSAAKFYDHMYRMQNQPLKIDEHNLFK